MRWGWRGCAAEPFSAPADGDHVLPVPRAAGRESGQAPENRCPGRAILPPIPQLVTQIKSAFWWSLVWRRLSHFAAKWQLGEGLFARSYRLSFRLRSR
jgi:hypothetical protein